MQVASQERKWAVTIALDVVCLVVWVSCAWAVFLAVAGCSGSVAGSGAGLKAIPSSSIDKRRSSLVLSLRDTLHDSRRSRARWQPL